MAEKPIERPERIDHEPPVTDGVMN